MAILVNNGKIFTLNGTAIGFNPSISGSWTFNTTPALPEGQDTISASGLAFLNTGDDGGTVFTDIGITAEGIVYAYNNGSMSFYAYTAYGWTLTNQPDTIKFNNPVNRADCPEFYDWFVVNAIQIK